jgi:site-specific DNA recombinase
MRATIYLRLSVDREGQTSTERQEADCRAWVAQHGGEVAAVRTDLGLSGFSGVVRPAYELATEDLRSGRSDTLVVWKLDRLSRRGIGQLGALLDDLERTGGRLVAVMDGIDTEQAGSRVVLAILAEVARQESANTGTRTRSAKARMADMGRWLGGRAPYGYAIDAGRLVLDPERAPVIRAVAARVAAGSSLRAEAHRLNAEGRTGYHGKPWRASRLSAVLRSPVMVGWLARGHGSGRPHRDAEGVPVAVTDEPLLSIAEWRAVIDALEARRPTAWVGRPPSTLLAGRIRCAACGERMSSNGSVRGAAGSYRCRGKDAGLQACPGNLIRADLAEDAVVASLLGRMAALEPGDPLLDAVARRWLAWKAPAEVEARTAAEGRLAELEGRMAELEDAYYVRGDLPADRFRRLSDTLGAEVARARSAVGALAVPEVDLGPLLDPVLAREAWAVASLEDRRAILGLAVEVVLVTPSKAGTGARGADRLAIAWADHEERAPGAGS